MACRGDGCVEHAPLVTVTHDRAGPDGEVVEAPLTHRGRAKGLAEVVPGDQILGDGVPHRRIRMPLARVPEGPRRLEEVEVVPIAVVGDPRVPDPQLLEA